VVLAKEQSDWKETVDTCISDFNNIEKLEVMPEILDLGQAHQLISYPAAILYHSKKINTEN
jgi:hypothetical protein